MFSGQNKKNTTNLSTAELAQLSVKGLDLLKPTFVFAFLVIGNISLRAKYCNSPFSFFFWMFIPVTAHVDIKLGVLIIIFNIYKKKGGGRESVNWLGQV